MTIYYTENYLKIGWQMVHETAIAHLKTHNIFSNIKFLI